MARFVTAAWPPEDLAELQKLWLGGLSAAECAKHFPGKTRNAVIGKVHREGWARAERSAASQISPKALRAPRVQPFGPRPPKPGRQNRPGEVFGLIPATNLAEANRARAIKEAYGKDAVAAVAAGVGVESPNARPMMDATGCRWPLGERGAVLACCNPISRGRYCEGHAAVAFNGFGAYRAKYGPHASVETIAVFHTRFERLDEYRTKNGPRPQPLTTVWDEGRAA